MFTFHGGNQVRLTPVAIVLFWLRSWRKRERKCLQVWVILLWNEKLTVGAVGAIDIRIGPRPPIEDRNYGIYYGYWTEGRITIKRWQKEAYLISWWKRWWGVRDNRLNINLQTIHKIKHIATDRWGDGGDWIRRWNTEDVDESSWRRLKQVCKNSITDLNRWKTRISKMSRNT